MAAAPVSTGAAADRALPDSELRRQTVRAVVRMHRAIGDHRLGDADRDWVRYGELMTAADATGRMQVFRDAVQAAHAELSANPY